MPRLLLLSNSSNPGAGYLAHARGLIRDFLGEQTREVVFIPYAGVQLTAEAYAAQVAAALSPVGIGVRSVEAVADPVAAVEAASAIVVGGGNTFQLLTRMYETGLLAAVRRRVLAGVPYVGWSAGANLACPTIRTTNDMPIIEPPSFVALNLVPFQINPHYTDRVLTEHGGETRDDRLAEFTAVNPTVEVYGLREGSWLVVEEGTVTLGGPHPMKRFRSGEVAREVGVGVIAG
ncbi:MAG: dipeptidase PepE [Gemmatimonadales bacterium]